MEIMLFRKNNADDRQQKLFPNVGCEEEFSHPCVSVATTETAMSCNVECISTVPPDFSHFSS